MSQLYARSSTGTWPGVVVETWPPVGGATLPNITTPSQAFGASFGAQFAPCPSNVLQGWTFDGVSTWAAPVTPAVTQAQLISYAYGKVAVLISATRNYTTIAGISSIKADGGPTTFSNLTALTAGPAAMAPTATTVWVDDTATIFPAITGAQLASLASLIVAYGQSVYAKLATVITGIVGSTITTTAQIDSAGWPT